MCVHTLHHVELDSQQFIYKVLYDTLRFMKIRFLNFHRCPLVLKIVDCTLTFLKFHGCPHLLSLIVFCFPCLFFLSFFLPSLFLLSFCIFLFFLHLLFLILLYWCLSISTFVFVLVSFSSSSSSAFFLVFIVIIFCACALTMAVAVVMRRFMFVCPLCLFLSSLFLYHCSDVATRRLSVWSPVPPSVRCDSVWPVWLVVRSLCAFQKLVRPLSNRCFGCYLATATIGLL